MKICLNGEYVDANEAKVSVYDNCFLSGYGVYETIRTYGGKIWQLGQHLERIRASANQLNIDLPYHNEDLAKMVEETIKINNFTESKIRITLTAGASKVYGKQNFGPNLLIMVEKLEEIDNKLKEEGVSVITFKIERTFPKVKSCNLLASYLGMQMAHKHNAYESLLINHRDEVTEGSITNVFFIKDGILITPKADILLGTTRNLIIDLAKSEDIKVDERSVRTEELNDMQECFITNAPRGIISVKEIINLNIKYNIAEGTTKLINKIFEDYIEEFKRR